MQILLQFYLDLFFLKKKETLQLFLSRSEVVHVIGYDIVFFFNMILTFSQMMDWLCNSSLH